MINVNAQWWWPTRSNSMSKLLHMFVCLVAILAFTGAGATLAAATVHGPISELVICGGDGAKTIRLDAQGNPVDGKLCCDCLDCLVLSGDLPVYVPDVQLWTATLPADRPLPTAPSVALSSHLRPLPRGPPAATPFGHVFSAQDGPFPTALEFGQVSCGKVVATGGQQTKVAR